MNTPLKQYSHSQSIPDDNSILTARALKAMAHPLRWRILCTLGSNELSVNEIVKKTGTSQSNVSQHLEQLRNKNIVTARKEANRVYYRIRNDQLLMLIGTMREVLCPANLNIRESTAKKEESLH
uniref:Transcriptional regulator, ArsR family n=1 Tax=Candidatus Kentrum sp. TUN TaxID=2126343 RepID=A0A450ZTL5_9GAMM|nr:MAG: transcriptional regulator, ArsR family [Candidatus Kentron sp. TUN]VFK57108.1 MAG: transcriptional regulator, ArsR family [Candidatus Kentron sp. TUN]VFK57892.1 MAG: transcriptional regulator, ArsR family [Candidatus Kentron sp. TUN]